MPLFENRILIKKWMVQDDQGKDIFFFELFYTDADKEFIYFDISLSLLGKHTKVLDLLDALLKMDLTLNEREALAKTFFQLIKKYKHYKKFYYPEEYLDKNGKLFEPTYLYFERQKQKNVDAMSKLKVKLLDPISHLFNNTIFIILTKYFKENKKEIFKQSMPISKINFEKLLTNDDLREAYVDVYSEKNKYYLFDDGEDVCSYFIIKANKLQLAFEDKLRNKIL